MEAFQTDSGFLYRFVRAECEGKTMNYVLREMKEVLGEEQPDPEQVRALTLVRVGRLELPASCSQRLSLQFFGQFTLL